MLVVRLRERLSDVTAGLQGTGLVWRVLGLPGVLPSAADVPLSRPLPLNAGAGPCEEPAGPERSRCVVPFSGNGVGNHSLSAAASKKL